VRARRRPDVAVLADVPPFDRYARSSLEPLIPHADRLRSADRAHDCTLVAGEGLEVLVLNGPAYRWAVQTLPGLADVGVLDLRRVEAALERQATFAG
jgi:hypothetical protein